MSRHAVVPHVLLFVALWAAGPRAPLTAQEPPPQATVHDSAGVRIVEYRTLRGPLPNVRVDSTPFFDIGGLRGNPDEELDPRQPWLSATRLTSGVVVVNAFARLQFFTRDGQLLRIVGREGNGPGEFTQTREICRLRGDSLLVIDYSTGRLSLWDSSGVHVRSYGRPGFVPLGACYPDGSVVARVTGSVDSAAAADPGSAPYARMRPDGTIIHRLGRLPIAEYDGTIIFEVSIVPVGDQVYVADARRYEVRVLDHEGRDVWILRTAEPPQPITDADWRRQAEASVPVGVPSAQRERQIAMMLSMKRPATWPAFHRMRVDPAQRIWIDDYRNNTLWTIFDARGGLIGRLQVPGAPDSNSRLVGVARDYVIVLHDDYDGAPHLSFYRLALPQ